MMALAAWNVLEVDCHIAVIDGGQHNTAVLP